MSKQWSMRESANYITVINEHGDAVFHEDKHCDGVMDDARLIAAAPELYESAVNAQKLLRTLYHETCDRLTKIVILERLNEMDASIKKARAGA